MIFFAETDSSGPQLGADMDGEPALSHACTGYELLFEMNFRRAKPFTS